MRLSRSARPARFISLYQLLTCLLLAFSFGAGISLRAEDKQPDKPLTEEEKKKAEEEKKKKIPPLKYDAWCAFSKLSERPIRENDPESTHSRVNSIGLEGFGRRGKWAHVVLDIQNTTELKKKISFEGTASIVFNQVQANGSMGTVPYSTSYRQTFKVGPETENQYHFSILCPEYGWNQNVEVRLDCRSAGLIGMSRFFQLRDLDQEHEELILVVSDTPGAFTYLGPMGGKKSGEDKDVLTSNDMNRPAGREVASVVPTELPERWQDLAIASLIIIDGPPSDALTPGQWDALKTYAQSGGRILIMAGKDPAKLKGPVEALAGITVRGTTELPGLDQFDPPYYGPKRSNPDDPEWKMPVVEVAAPGAGVVKRNSKNQVVEYCARSYGAGVVAFVPYSLTDKLLEYWHGRVTIPMGLINKEKNLFAIDVDSDDDNTAQQNYSYAGFFQNSIKPINNKSLSTFRTRLDKSFEDDTPVVMQSPATVLNFLLMYLVCAVPLNFLLFSVLKRREAAWIATPLIALGFTIAAYYTGYSGQTGVTTINQVTVLEAGPGQGEAVGRTFMGVYAPRRDNYHIAFPPQKLQHGGTFDVKAAPGHLVNQDYFEKRNVDLPEMEVFDSGQRLDIEQVLILQRSTRRFEIMHRASLGEGVELRATASSGGGPGSTEIAVNNKTGVALISPMFFKNDQFAMLKANDSGNNPTVDKSNRLRMEPNEQFDSTQTAVNWRNGRAQAFEEFSRQMSVGGKHTADRAKALSDYFEAHCRQYSAGVFLAWVEGPVLPVVVASSGSTNFDTPTIEGITLLVVPVASSNKGSRFGAAAFVPPRVDYATFYNPEVRESGEWKPLKGKVAFEGLDAEGKACLYLKLTFEDLFSRSYYEDKRTRLSYKIGDPQGSNGQQKFRGRLNMFVRNDGAVSPAQRFFEPSAYERLAPGSGTKGSLYQDTYTNFFKGLKNGTMILKIVPKPNQGTTYSDFEKLTLDNFKIDLVEPPKNP